MIMRGGAASVWMRWQSDVVEETTWSEVAAAIEAAPYPMEILSADPTAASDCLTALGMTTKSWLGALVANSGGLVADHGWLRILGSGHTGLPDVASAAQIAQKRLVVGFDVMGGQYAWFQPEPADKPTVHYFGPDTLDWQNLGQGYADWLYAVLAGSLTGFYETLRWPGWEQEVALLTLDQGISVWPPPWSAEGNDVGAASRKAIPLAQLVAFYEDTAVQLGSATDA